MRLTKLEHRKKVKMRVRKHVFGTPEKPRLSVFRSNRQIYVQAIDDLHGVTLVSASSREKEVAEKLKGDKKAQAAMVGELIARKLKDKGIETAVFDRNGYLFRGRVKELADAARKRGLKF